MSPRGAGHCPTEALAPALISLDGAWQFCLDPENAGRDAAWFAPQEGGPATQTIRVPSVWEELHPGYDVVAWYWREFDVQAIPAAGSVAYAWGVDWSASDFSGGGRHGMRAV